MARIIIHGIAGAALSAIALSGASAQTMPVQDSDETPADEQAASSSEIVVTASKREERLQDVPAAITALTGSELNNLGVQDFRDYVTLVPGLSQRDLGAPGVGTIILRGLNSGGQQTTNTAAFYVDNTQFTPSGFLSTGGLLTPNPDLGDVSRIEVLKGPQGTLYGANSLGGVIRVILKPADSTAVEGNVRGEVTTIDGGGTGYSLRASANLPIIADKLAVRVSGFYRDTPGFIDNLDTGRKNVNTSEQYGGRLAIRFTPTEDLTLDLTGLYQKINNIGTATQFTEFDSLEPRVRRYGGGGFADLPTELEYRLVSGDLSYSLGRVNWITNVSYAEYESSIQSDSTADLLGLVRLFAPTVPADAVTLTDIGPNTEKFTAETRLVSDRIGAFEFVVGGFYTKEDSAYATRITALDGTTLAPLSAPLGLVFNSSSLSDYEEYAGFGNITAYLTDQFDVTGGIRVSHTDETVTLGAPLGGQPSLSFYRPRATSSFTATDTPVTYLGTARWRPTDLFSAYVRAASGYRPGGPQTNIAPPAGAQTIIRPDTVWNYEAGVKGRTADASFSYDVSVYHIDWSDIQLATLFGATILQGNGGAADIDGAEGVFELRPSRSLTFGINLAYTRARITSIDPGATASIGARVGDRLPLTPEYTVALIADKQFALSDAVSASVGGTLRFQSDMTSDFTLDPTAPNVIPSYETVDLRGSLLFGERYQLQVRVDNLFDRFGFTTLGAQGPGTGTVIRPRTFTLSMSTDF
jgi:outer membrane receptor protein involved in Fe transport